MISWSLNTGDGKDVDLMELWMTQLRWRWERGGLQEWESEKENDRALTWPCHHISFFFISHLLDGTCKKTKSPNLQCIKYKTLHKHYTGQSMFQMGVTHSNICIHCTGYSAKYYMHAIWSCMHVQGFMQRICGKISTWFNCCVLSYPHPNYGI